MPNFDVAVLGGGPGGYAAALRAAVRGASVCCIEAGKLGGTCLNVGCIPTKAMLHASELAWNIRHASRFGISAGQPEIDGPAFMKRCATVVAGLGKGVEFLLKGRKVEIIRGRGRLSGTDTLVVETDQGTRKIQAGSIIVATGSTAVRPSFLPWESGRVVTTDEATTALDLPESALIVGGGVIGCEFATMYAELGIATTLIEMLDWLVAPLDADASRAITKSLSQRGVTVVTGAKVAAAQASETGVVTELEDGQRFESAQVLVAVGRKANIENIGLEEIGIETDHGVIKVDDRCRTNVETVYAVGDAAETRQYAHLATRMGLVAADNAAGGEARDPRTVVPVGVYTHPEVASVGLTEQEAQQGGEESRVSRFPYMASGMAHAYGETDGMVKLIGHVGNGKVLGATVIGQHATDVIQGVALAMRNGLTIQQVAETIHAHPTFVEAVGEAAEAWLGLPLHGGR